MHDAAFYEYLQVSHRCIIFEPRHIAKLDFKMEYDLFFPTTCDVSNSQNKQRCRPGAATREANLTARYRW